MNDNIFNDNEISNFNDKAKKKFNKIYLFIIVFVFVLIAVIGSVMYNKYLQYRNSYEYIEDKIEEEARKYVKNNNLSNEKAFYIELHKLNIELKSNCYSISGILVENGNYQPYLICDDYETVVNSNKNDYIELNGRSFIFLNKGTNYIEPYYKLLSDVTVNIESNISQEEGVYDVTYNILQNNVIIDKLVKKVIILDNKEIEKFYPNISLNGEGIEYIELNSEYIEKGANAFDSVDGIVNDIRINGEVNINQSGEYNLSYIAVNSRGYPSVVTRKVFVISSNNDIFVNHLLSPSDFTSESVIITLNINGLSYDYTLLPNDKIETSEVIQYEVSENGKYTFNIYTKTGMFQTKEITIENIDKEKPNGVCSGYYIDNKSYITINANDNISGIEKYIINNIEYKDKTISLDGEIKDVKIVLYDKVNNFSEISCQLEDRNPVTSACNDKTIYPGNKYTFTQEQKEKMAAMVSAEADGNPKKAEDYLGMKLVASHMCNYYEKLYPNEEWTGKRLHWLITNSGWYAEMTKKSKFDSNNERHQLALKAVEEVIVNGNRILPHYIDEFDMFPEDVMKPLTNVDDYVRDQTVYYGYGWIKVTFWCINIGPDGKGGNIFGYTKKPNE